MSNSTLISIIEDSGLGADEKATWVTRVENEGASPALINEFRATLRIRQEQLTREASALIAQDPQGEDLADQLNAEIDAATVDFEAEMHGLQKEAEGIASEASRTIEKITAEEKLDQLSDEE